MPNQITTTIRIPLTGAQVTRIARVRHCVDRDCSSACLSHVLLRLVPQYDDRLALRAVASDGTVLAERTEALDGVVTVETADEAPSPIASPHSGWLVRPEALGEWERAAKGRQKVSRVYSILVHEHSAHTTTELRQDNARISVPRTVERDMVYPQYEAALPASPSDGDAFTSAIDLGRLNRLAKAMGWNVTGSRSRHATCIRIRPHGPGRGLSVTALPDASTLPPFHPSRDYRALIMPITIR